MKNVICVTLFLLAAYNSHASDSASSNAKPGVVVKEKTVVNPALSSKDSYYIDINNSEGDSVNTNELMVQETRVVDATDGSVWERMSVLQSIGASTGQITVNSIIKFIEKNSSQDKAVFYKTMYASCSIQYYADDKAACYRRFLNNGYVEYAYIDLKEFEALSLIVKVCSRHYYADDKAICFENMVTKNLEKKYSYLLKGCADNGTCMYNGFLELIKQNNYYSYFIKLSI